VIDEARFISRVEKKIKKKLEYAIKICCAFAGYNAAAVFRKTNKL
jgi:hypothetical protein